MTTDNRRAKRVPLVRTAACVFVCAAIAGLSSAPTQTLAQTPKNYRLAAIYQVPDTPPTRLVNPKSVKVAAPQREVLVLETEPPSVVVMTPEGSILRRFGEEVLSDPTDLAPVYQSVPEGDRGIDTGRVMVTESSLGKLHIFDAVGRHVRTIEDDWTPHAIVGIGESQPERAFIADLQHGRIVAVDWDGNILSTEMPITEVDLGLPTLLAGATNRYAVFDAATRNLIWFDGTGSVRMEVRFDGWPMLAEMSELLAMTVTSSKALLSTETGLWAISWEPGLEDEPLDIRKIQPGPIHDQIVSIEAAAVSSARPPFYRALHVYALHGHPAELTRIASTSSSDWTDSSYQPLHKGCPMVWERTAAAWRLAMNERDEPNVLMTNGVLHGLLDGEMVPLAGEVGHLDDFAIDHLGRIQALTRRVPMTYVQEPLGWTSWPGHVAPYYWRRAWEPTIDCFDSGIGFRPALSLPDTHTEESIRVLTTQNSGSDENLFHSRLGLSFDVVAYIAPVEGRMQQRGQVMLTYSHHTIDAPIISDVALLEDGLRGAIVDRLGGRVRVFTVDHPVDWSTALSWPVPGRPDRAVWTADGHLLVLTADGWLFELDGTGEILGGWDAAGLAPAPRPTLVDIEVAKDGTIYALDKYERRLLEFAPSNEPTEGPPVSLPPPCSIQTASAAMPSQVAVGAPVTTTLELGGACGRASAENDIMIIMQPPVNEYVWSASTFYNAVNAFVESLDPIADRVGLMVFNANSDILVPLGVDFEAVTETTSEVARMKPEYAMTARPLLSAAEHFEDFGRPEAQRVIVLFTTGDFSRKYTVDRLVLDAEDLRLSGIRIIVVCGNQSYCHMPALVAYQPEDFHLAPDGPTMQAVYAQLGREFGARLLAREVTITAALPDDMEYVVGSADPPAAWDEARRTLEWEAQNVGFGGWRASFQVRPQLVGDRPVIRSAAAEVIDGFGNRLNAPFANPWVRVFEPPPPTPTSTVTPTPTTTATPTATLIPSPTATPEPRPIHIPLALVESPCKPELTPVDAILAIDTSGSMAGAKLAAAQGAAIAFAEAMNLGRDRVGVVSFDGAARTVIVPTTDIAAIRSAVAGLSVRVGTRVDLGLAAALTLLPDGPRPGATAAIVLLTDGKHDGSLVEALLHANAARERGVALYAVGLGEDADLGLLQLLTRDPRRVHATSDPAALASIYRAIARALPCPPERWWGRR